MAGRVPLTCGSFPPPENRVKYPHFSTCMRRFCHGTSSLFLPVGAGRPGLAVRHAPVVVATDPAACPTTLDPMPPRPKRHRAPTPFEGFITKPHCDACEHAPAPHPHAPAAPPPRLGPTRGRPRQVDTSWHFCPHPHCAYRGWRGLGSIR